MKKKIHYLLAAIAMLVSQILPISNVFATQPLNPNNYARIEIKGPDAASMPTAITDANGDTNTVTVTYPHGTVTATGSNLYSDNNYTVYALGNLTLTATPATNYAADFMENGNLIGSATKAYTGLTAGGFHRIDGIFSFPTVTSGVTYTNTNDPIERLTINDKDFDFSKNQISYEYNGSGTVKVTMETFATLAYITSVNINGTPYAVPTATADILNLAAEDGQVFRYTFNNVPKADSYTIATTTTRSTIFGGFSWSYKDVDKNEDNYVGNGYLEIQEVEYNGTKYTGEAAIIAANLPYLRLNRTPENDYGEIMLPTGSKVTLKLIPNAGYQLTSFTVNGGEFEAQEEVGTYIFTSESGNFHLGAHFTKVADAVKADDADAVTSGSITLGNGELDNGTARLEVKNAEGLEPADIENFEGNAEGYNLKTILDIKLFNTIYKGTASESWDNQLDELNHEATITLKLDPSVDGNDVIIVHEKHDGTYEVIPTVYDPVNHTITFKTSSFSNYAIATRTIASPNTGFMTREGGSVVEDNTAIAIIGTLSLWGLLAFVAKKGLAND